MKLSITELRTVRQWRAATGLDAVRFEALVPLFAAAYQRVYGASMAQRPTINPVGATFADEGELLFFMLFSLKIGPDLCRTGVLLPKGYCWRIRFKPLLKASIVRRRPDGSGLMALRLTN